MKTITMLFTAALLALSASTASAGEFDRNGRNLPYNGFDNPTYNTGCTGYSSSCPQWGR